jgi:hypothetical protein
VYHACGIIESTIFYTHVSYIISHIMGAWACPARFLACIQAWIHSAAAAARSFWYSSQSTADSIMPALYGPISASPLLAASKYGDMLFGHCAVLVRCLLQCCPSLKFGLQSSTNQVKSHHCSSHQLQPPSQPRCRLPWSRWRLQQKSPW